MLAICLSVVTSAFCDDNILFFSLALDGIDQPVFLRDPPRPPTAPITLQGFGLARSPERIPPHFVNQMVELDSGIGRFLPG